MIEKEIDLIIESWANYVNNSLVLAGFSALRINRNCFHNLAITCDGPIDFNEDQMRIRFAAAFNNSNLSVGNDKNDVYHAIMSNKETFSLSDGVGNIRSAGYHYADINLIHFKVKVKFMLVVNNRQERIDELRNQLDGIVLMPVMPEPEVEVRLDDIHWDDNLEPIDYGDEEQIDW